VIEWRSAVQCCSAVLQRSDSCVILCVYSPSRHSLSALWVFLAGVTCAFATTSTMPSEDLEPAALPRMTSSTAT
jgi:hypothetical protein